MSLKENIETRKLATKFVDEGIEWAVHEGVVAENMGNFWHNVMLLASNMTGRHVRCHDCGKKALGRGIKTERVETTVHAQKKQPKKYRRQNNPDRVKRLAKYAQFTDRSTMPFGKHKGSPVGNVPAGYWQWFIDQEFADEWLDVKEYAKKKGVYNR